MVERECPNCGNSYMANATRLAHGRQTTCSRACSYELRAKALTTAESLVCATCGATFTRAPKAIKGKHGAQFCSRECHYAGRSLGVTRRVVTTRYVYTPASKAALIAAARTPKGKRVIHRAMCANCGIEFVDSQGWRKRKAGQAFCSSACCNSYRTGARNPAWRGGHPDYYGPNWRALRRAARVRDNYTCRRCGADHKPPRRAPDVHHIASVGSFANPDDANTLDNVVCLCHPCHMHVEWHGIDFPL